MDFSDRNWMNSSDEPKTIMENGDMVIIYERHEVACITTLETGKVYCNKYGRFKHDDIIGKPFGSMIYSSNIHSEGFIYVLSMIPEILPMAVTTKTQIVDEFDSSYILFHLDVFPGCNVIESGTGSGCLTVAIARAVAPYGIVNTFEYNKSRAELSKKQFKNMKLDKFINVYCQDVSKYGFHLPPKSVNELSSLSSSPLPSSSIGDTSNETCEYLVELEDNSADAVFLDLPEPWNTIESAWKKLKSGRRICTYSPCIEQVVKTREKLESGFHSIKMVEVRIRSSHSKMKYFDIVDMGNNNNDNNTSTNDGGEIDGDDGDYMGEGLHNVIKNHTNIDYNNNNLFGIEAAAAMSIGKQDKLVNIPAYSMKGHTAFLTFATKI